MTREKARSLVSVWKSQNARHKDALKRWAKMVERTDGVWQPSHEADEIWRKADELKREADSVEKSLESTMRQMAYLLEVIVDRGDI